MAKGLGVFTPAGDDDNGGDKGRAADEVNLSKLVGSLREPKSDKGYRGILGAIDKIVDKGKARQEQNRNRKSK